MVRHTPASLILNFCRARIAEQQMECDIRKEYRQENEQRQLLALQLARAQAEQTMYLSAVPPGFMVADVVCREDLRCVQNKTPNTSSFRFEYSRKHVRNSLKPSGHHQPTLLIDYLGCLKTTVVLVEQIIAQTSFALQVNYLQARWDEHQIETALRKARSADGRHQVRLVKLKLARLRAELKLYNSLSHRHGTVAPSLDAVCERSDEE